MSLSATNNTALANPQISRNGTINGSHTRTSVVSCSKLFIYRSFRLSSGSSRTRDDATGFAMGSSTNDFQDGRYHAISPPPPTATTISNNTAQASSIPVTTGTLSRHNSSGDSGYTSSQQNNRWRHRDVMLKQNISPYSSDVSKWCPPDKKWHNVLSSNVCRVESNFEFKRKKTLVTKIEKEKSIFIKI